VASPEEHQLITSKPQELLEIRRRKEAMIQASKTKPGSQPPTASDQPTPPAQTTPPAQPPTGASTQEKPPLDKL
jgi:hypothetical protein